MTKQLFPIDILSQVQKPARYTGGELNSIVKDWAGAQRSRRGRGK